MSLGKIIIVDLTSGRVENSDYTEEMARKYIGGFGFNTACLYENIPRETGALAPENILMITCGLLTGTAVPSSSRFHLSAKSPLSGFMGSSNVGGKFGVKMAACGVRSIIVKGRAESPVYLLVDENGVEIRDAAGLWGLDTRKTDAALKGEVADPGIDTLCIGPAGENLVPFACIMAGMDHAAGRTGMGAVMGSKNLKALAVVASRKADRPDPKTRDAVKRYVGKLKGATERFHSFSTWGSAGDIVELYEFGALSAKNYREQVYEGAENIDGRRLDDFVVKKTSCPRCPVHCKAEVKIAAGRNDFIGGRPEYETVIDMGALCGLFDPEGLLYVSNLANILGLDTISTGSVIAFAMDLWDRGILTAGDTGGIEFSWGNADAMAALMEQIARREGLGKILSGGVREASRIIGKGAEAYAYHAKGVEIYGGDPRGAMGIALSYAISLRGGDFTSVYPIAEFRYTPEMAEREFGTPEAVNLAATEGKGALVRKCMFVSAIIDSVGICKVPALSIIGDLDLVAEAEFISTIFGFDITAADLFAVGERIVNMEKLFNLRHGATPEDDNLPKLFTEVPLTAGPAKGRRVRNLRRMVADFYRSMGWDENGVPTKAKLASLGL